MRILIVEDEERIAQDIGQALSAANYVVRFARDGEEADFIGYTEDFDAVILDLGLPKIDGLTVLNNWRRAGRRFPVLILTVRNSWQDKVEGMDIGADDFLTKPFEMEELLARVRALIRRSDGFLTSHIECGSLIVDSRTSKVFLNGRILSLSPLEFKALNYLIHNCGRPVPRVELMEHIYDRNNFRDENTLDVLIGRLRKKVGPNLIRTRRGVGYVIE
ncbi:MAG: DNA-binding response regulator [Hyphomicrobiales bacterium]|nr:MAG: DNA-binding response regulator [Hyphomicrobiales bacterium]